MNLKRILGLSSMFLGLLIPFQSAFLNIGSMNNTLGLISFIASLVLLFTGYALVDSSFPKPGTAGNDDAH